MPPALIFCSYLQEPPDLGTPLPLQLLKGVWDPTESQNGYLWKGAQRVIWSILTVQVGSSQGIWNRFASRWLLSISSDRDSTLSLGNLFQRLITCTVKSSSCSSGTTRSPVLPVASSCCLASLTRAWLCPLATLHSDTHRQ